MNRKKILTLIVAILTISVLSVLVLTACSGNKTDDEVLPAETKYISNAEDLANLKNYTGKKYSEFVFELTADIALDGYDNWQPIGSTLPDAFCATLDGKGHTISSLTINGLDENNAPLEMGAGRSENTTSYFAAGLFGYTNSATVKNLKLTGVDIQYYVDIDFGYAGALVGYNYGDKSTFENIEIEGNINLSNLYEIRRTFTNTGEYQSLITVCDATEYIGGLMAFSSGKTSIKDVKCSVNINNEKYVAYYCDENSTAEGEEYEEGYVVSNSWSYYGVKPKQVFVGGIAGLLKNGTVENSEYTGGTINVCAKNIYSGGLVGGIYGAEIKESAVDGANITATAYNKNVSGGAVAISDAGKVSNVIVNNARMNVSQRDALQNLSAGGIFGFLCNLGEISDCEVNNLILRTATDKVNVGGIGGVVRNANLKDSVSHNATFAINVQVVDESAFAKFAAVVSAIYGTSDVRDCSGSAKNIMDRNGNTVDNEIIYAVAEDLSYVDEDGKPAVRIYKEDEINEYLTVAASINDDNNKLTVTVFDEELTELAVIVFTGTFENTDNVVLSYMELWYNDGVGVIDSDGNSVEISGRNLTEYEFRSGKPAIENLTLEVIGD